MRDILFIVDNEYESDGEGGRRPKNYEEEHPPVATPIRCKASFDTNPEVAAAYGLQSEQVLYVFTSSPLDEEGEYYYMGKRYTVRHMSPSNRLFYSILIEEKE